MKADYYDSLVGAVDVIDLMQRVDDAVQALGFCDYAYLWPVNAGFETEWLTTLPMELVAYYFEHQLYADDPAVQYAERSTRRGSALEFKRLVARNEGALVRLCRAIDRVLADKYSTLPGLQTFNKRSVAKITPKALQALDLLANNDFTHKQIAERMFVVPGTINDHLNSARQAIGVANSHSAIKYAVINGLIDYEY